MKPKHTPGPWAVTTDSIIHLYRPTGPDGEGFAVAEMYDVRDEDLSLITAAPELLEALDKAVRLLWSEHCEYVERPDKEEFFKREDIKELMKAIAKAEGRS